MLTDNIKDTCLNLDLYGRPVRMHFQGHDVYRTKVGACCTITMGLIVIAYAVFTLVGLLSPQAHDVVPVHSKILHKSFYEIYPDRGNLVQE